MRKIPEDKMEIIRIAVPAVLESLISVVITTIDTLRKAYEAATAC